MARMKIELPSGIRGRDDEWTKDVVLEHMTGDEEDILADATREGKGRGTMKMSASERITAILSRCTVSIGADERGKDTSRDDAPDYFKGQWHAAFTSDRMFAIVRLRTLSIGNRVTLKIECPHCEQEFKPTVDLDDLEVTSVPLSSASEVEKKFAFPSGDNTVMWRTFTSKDEEPLNLIRKNHKDQMLSMILARRVVSDAKGSKDVVTMLKKAASGDRRAFADTVDRTEGGINLLVTHTCPNTLDCGRSFDAPLEVGTSFFFPSDSQEISSSTSPDSLKPGNGAEKKSEGSPSTSGSSIPAG